MKRLSVILALVIGSLSVGSPSEARGCVAYNADMAWVMKRESGGSPHANNPRSTAYGCYQLLAGTARSYGGYSAAAAHRYVRDRYGSWAKAKRHHQRNGWY